MAPGVPAPQPGRSQQEGVDGGRPADRRPDPPPDPPIADLGATRPRLGRRTVAAATAAGELVPPGSADDPRDLDPRDLDRQRLARDLHDVVGQALTAVRLAIVALGRDGLPDRSRAPLDACLAQIDEALRAVRSFVRELRPPLLADLGLEAAARAGVARHAGLAGFRGRVRTVGLEAGLPPAIETVCYRILEEALTNVDRHAGASRVDVVVRRSRTWLELVVTDDGRGFDLARAMAAGATGASSGLWGMRARVLAMGGELDIRTRPGAGTRVRARLPIPRRPSAVRFPPAEAPPAPRGSGAVMESVAEPRPLVATGGRR